MGIRKRKKLLDALIKDPGHRRADLWFEDAKTSVYATLFIHFRVGLRIFVEMPDAKAQIIEILQLLFEADRARDEKLESMWGRRRRTGIGEVYGKRNHLAEPLKPDTVTHYMIDAQKCIREAIEAALEISLKGVKLPDFLFVRGNSYGVDIKSWGVRIRPPGIMIHHSSSGEAELLA